MSSNHVPVQTARGKWERGYQAPLRARDFLKECHRTRPWLTVLTALSDHALILAIAAAAYVVFLRAGALFAILLYPLSAIGCLRRLRGLENLVHEGSHFNWSRSNHRLNDLLCNLLAAVPVFSDIVRYRPGHKLHHFSFGTDEDADAPEPPWERSFSGFGGAERPRPDIIRRKTRFSTATSASPPRLKLLDRDFSLYCGRHAYPPQVLFLHRNISFSTAISLCLLRLKFVCRDSSFSTANWSHRRRGDGPKGLEALQHLLQFGAVASGARTLRRRGAAAASGPFDGEPSSAPGNREPDPS